MLLSKYFWTNRTPEQTAKDLERIIRQYLALWKKEKVVLIGYSLRADIGPFAANRLNEEVKSRIFEYSIILLKPKAMLFSNTVL